MTYREYLKTCDDFEKAVILVNIGRRVSADLPEKKQKQQFDQFLDEEINERKNNYDRG